MAGVLLTGFLGWLLGKAIIKTRGIFTAWLVQPPLDVLVFSFWILGPLKL
jgi:hypothetical protein